MLGPHSVSPVVSMMFTTEGSAENQAVNTHSAQFSSKYHCLLEGIRDSCKNGYFQDGDRERTDEPGTFCSQKEGNRSKNGGMLHKDISVSLKELPLATLETI